MKKDYPEEDYEVKVNLITMWPGDRLTTPKGMLMVYISLYEGPPGKRIAIKSPDEIGNKGQVKVPGKDLATECDKGRTVFLHEGFSYGIGKDGDIYPKSLDLIFAAIQRK